MRSKAEAPERGISIDFHNSGSICAANSGRVTHSPDSNAKQAAWPSTSEKSNSNTHEARQPQVITWEAGLMSTVKDMSSPSCRWYDMDGENGKMGVASHRLLVRQSRKGHEQVVEVLEQLEMAADDHEAPQ